MTTSITTHRQESLPFLDSVPPEQGSPIYCDHHATTPADPEVVAAMLPYFTTHFANPSSSHSLGQGVQEAVESARGVIAQAIHADPSEIIFTSGATEANNLAIKGVAEAYCHKGKHLITVVTEHRAVLEPMTYLKDLGFEVTVLPVQPNGHIDLQQLEAAIRPDTILLSLMAANNEIGVLHPLAEVGQIARRHNILFHSDAAQAFTKIPLDVQAFSIDLMSLTAHKIYGPKGVGALYVRHSPTKLATQIHGGGQEQDLRSGTLNVPLIVGFGAAVRLGVDRMERDTQHLHQLREELWNRLSSLIPDIQLNGLISPRLPGNLNISIPNVDGRALMLALQDHLVVSSGSACSAGAPSHVLLALGHSEALAHASLRFGLGRGTSMEEVEQIAFQVTEAVQSLQQLARYK